MPTQTEQVRQAITVSGTLQYKITITVVDPGDFPTSSLFVVSINETTDPKEDTFARVATIADFTEVGDDRSAVITAGELLYRAATFTFYYDNLETANNAQNVLKEKIDELVEDYALYQTEFEAIVAETTTHPQVEAATFTAAVTAYQDALRDTLDAETARDAAQTAYTEAQAAATTATTDASASQIVADDCATTKGYFDILETAFVSLDTEGDAFLAAAQTYYQNKVESPTPDTFDTAFLAAINVFIGNLRVAEAVKTQAAADKIAFATICGDRSSENTTKQTAKTTADTAVATARTTFEEAQAAVEVAQTAENAALAAVQALKSDFDPTSVEPSPAEE